MFQADLTDPDKFFLRPNSPHWIVRTTKNQKRHFGKRCLPFQILEINLIRILFFHKLRNHQISSILLHRGSKRMIDRAHNQHTLTRLCKCRHHLLKRWHNSRDLHNPFSLRQKSMMSFHKMNHRIIILIRRARITQNRLIQIALKTINQLWRRLKFHVGNRKRNNIGRYLWHLLSHHLPLFGASARSVY